MPKDSIEQAISVLEAEEANLTPEQRQRLGELSKAGESVRENVTDTLGTKEKRELSPEQAEELLRTLKTRFELPENEELRKMVDFADVEKALRAAPEKLYALNKLEETGGEPQVIRLDGDEFVFEDRCKEASLGRIHLNFDQSLAQAKEFGVDMQSPEDYKAMQETGKFNIHSFSWLKTDPEYRKRTGRAMCAHRCCEDKVSVVELRADSRWSNPGQCWRASLRVKKV